MITENAFFCSRFKTRIRAISDITNRTKTILQLLLHSAVRKFPCKFCKAGCDSVQVHLCKGVSLYEVTVSSFGYAYSVTADNLPLIVTQANQSFPLPINKVFIQLIIHY